MKRLIAAAALTPMMLASGAFAQTVPEEVDMQLWCGTAMVLFFSNPPPDLTPEEQKEAEGYIAGGTALLETVVQAHLDAGFTQEAIDAKKAEYETTVMQEITGDAATYSFEDCLALLPEADDTPSSGASDSSSSSAM